MSGIEVIGSTSAILTVLAALDALDTVAKLSSAIEDSYHLPHAFRAAAKNLPLVRETLQMVKGHIEEGNPDATACRAIKLTVESFKEKAERLKSILQEIAPQPDIMRPVRYRLALLTLGKGSRVEELMKGMLEDLSLLATERVVAAASGFQPESDSKDGQRRRVAPISHHPPLPLRPLSPTMRQRTSGFPKMRPCYIISLLVFFIVAGSASLGIYCTIALDKMGDGFTAAGWVVAIGALALAGPVAYHYPHCTCWKREGPYIEGLRRVNTLPGK